MSVSARTGRPLPEPLATGGADALPAELAPRRLLRRFVQVVALLAVIVLVALLAPGLDEVRQRLGEASPGWLAVAVVLEALSCGSYLLMFRPIFCRRMSWRTSAQIAWSELAAGALVPASGAGGLALGAWILHRGGMPAERIARRSVAFFLIKSSVNFVAVAVLGTLMASGLVGPHRSLLLTALPAALSVAVIALVLVIRGWGRGAMHAPTLPGCGAPWSGLAGPSSRAPRRPSRSCARAISPWSPARSATGHSTTPSCGPRSTPSGPTSRSPVMMGYLIGQLGGLLPLPGGVGGIDGGLLGTLVVYGAPAAPTVAAVLAYRVILFWLPLLGGAIAFLLLRRALDRAERPDLCVPIPAT